MVTNRHVAYAGAKVCHNSVNKTQRRAICEGIKKEFTVVVVIETRMIEHKPFGMAWHMCLI